MKTSDQLHSHGYTDRQSHENVAPFQPIGKLAMPPTELCVCVGANEVGYLTPDMGEKHILTWYLSTCIGLYTRNIVDSAQTLAHLAANKEGNARAFIKFAREQGLLESSAQEIDILQSPYASDKDVLKVTRQLNEFGANNIKVLKKQESEEEDISTINVIYDLEGKMYELTDPRNMDSGDPLKDARVHLRCFSPSLWVTNDGRKLKDPLKDD